MANIPRTHLTFYARLWEGTSGDRVLNAGGQKFKGQVFAVVVPNWCTQQKRTLDASTSKDVEALQKRLVEGGLRLPGEKVTDFLKRIHP